MGVMTTKNVFQDAVTAAVRALLDHSKDSILSQIDGRELVTTYSPDTPAEQINAISGPGYGILTIEGQTYGSNQLYRDYPVTLSMKKYTSKFIYTEEDLHWLQKGSEQKRAMTFRNIEKSGLDPLLGNLNRDLAKMFYLGFGTTNFACGDGYALFSASHTIRKTGGTQSNILSTEYTLNAASLDLMITEMCRLSNMAAVQLKKPRRLRLVVPVELESTAIQALDSLYGPGNANLGLQKASTQQIRRRGIDIDVVTLPEISSSYAAYWFLVDLDRAQDSFLLAEGWMPRQVTDPVYSNGTYEIDASVYFGPTALGATWVMGSRGTGGTL